VSNRALPVRCREPGKRIRERSVGDAHDRVGAGQSGGCDHCHPDRRKGATVLATVKVRPGKVGVCGTDRAAADLDGVCARRRSGRQVGAKERLPDRTKERIASSAYADFSSARYVRVALTYRTG
jgi:hypothetical protein